VGYPTVRIYNVFEVRIVDPSLTVALLSNSEQYSDQDLWELALQDARRGGKGRANAVLALPLSLLIHAYLAMSPAARGAPVTIAGHHLDSNIPAALEGIDTPRFQKAY
jgi:hypothetical protein